MECTHYVEGVSCPHLSKVIPSAYCLQSCGFNDSGECAHDGEKKRAKKTGEPTREVTQVWDDYCPMCALPRLIAMAELYEGEEV